MAPKNAPIAFYDIIKFIAENSYNFFFLYINRVYFQKITNIRASVFHVSQTQSTLDASGPV